MNHVTGLSAPPLFFLQAKKIFAPPVSIAKEDLTKNQMKDLIEYVRGGVL